ncbi:MAG: lmo0937 family membrane protein [Thiobacillus sp.]|nr:lmo0937 family membrane protein [Thiobacillus sp.]
MMIGLAASSTRRWPILKAVDLQSVKMTGKPNVSKRVGSSGYILYFIGSEKMLGTIAIILIVLWLLGMVSAYTMGGFIHILLVIAIVVILVRVIQGRGV